MEFSGRLYFDFTSVDVYRFYRLLASAQADGAVLHLDWRAFPAMEGASDRFALAASELVRVHAPGRHRAFVQVLLAAVHLERADLDDPNLIRASSRAAGITSDVVTEDRISTEGTSLLAGTMSEAEALGVREVPTIYRHGPVVRIRTTPAVDGGNSLASLETIDRMLEDDTLWELSKP